MAEILSYRDALYYAMTGLPFNGKKAAEIRLVNYSVPAERLRDETVSLAKLLMEKNPNALRFTKEAVRAVKGMSHDQAQQYLYTKLQALQGLDKDAHKKGIAQFLDEKSTGRHGILQDIAARHPGPISRPAEGDDNKVEIIIGPALDEVGPTLVIDYSLWIFPHAELTALFLLVGLFPCAQRCREVVTGEKARCFSAVQ